MFSESAEEERIVIEDRVEGESYVVRTVVAEICVQEGEEPVPPGKVLTPVTEERETEKDEKSSSGESSVSPKSHFSVTSSGKRVLKDNEVPFHLRVPTGYRNRTSKVHVRFIERTG